MALKWDNYWKITGFNVVTMNMQQLYYYIMKILLSGPSHTKKLGHPGSIHREGTAVRETYITCM